ncbi:MAG: hypothetical protein MK212_07660 [Saprospiraceae bacterium]|nr:hypothetical protein [Saprospiraceae bacterium]
MIILYTKYSKEKLKLNNKLMASGGEGKIYVVNNKKGYLAKIFHEKKRNNIRYQKLIFMLKNPPFILDNLVWPEDIILDENRKFMGYLMKKVEGQKLELFCLPKIERGFYDKFPNFEVRSKSTLKHRIRVAYRILASLYQLHSCGRYTLVDLKPENILLYTPKKFHVLDLDSVQVVENGKVLFPAIVITPEYAPPEQRWLKSKDRVTSVSWDYFSWGIVLYKFLYGVHPYAASSKAPYDQFSSLKQKIEQGLFVHDPKLRSSFLKIPVLHNLFRETPQAIQQLFMQCFVEGHKNKEARPSFGDWLHILENWVSSSDQVGFKYEYTTDITLAKVNKVENVQNIYTKYSPDKQSLTEKPQQKEPVDKNREEDVPHNLSSNILFSVLGSSLIWGFTIIISKYTIFSTISWRKLATFLALPTYIVFVIAVISIIDNAK